LKPVLIVANMAPHPETPVPFSVPQPPWKGFLRIAPEEPAEEDNGSRVLNAMEQEVIQMAMEVGAGAH